MIEHSRISPVVALLAVSSEWEARVTAALQEIGLTARRYGLLAHLQVSPGLSFSELARQSRITVQSAHSSVRALVAAGLVSDSTAQAGAASHLAVTREGAEALVSAERILAVLDRELAHTFPDLGPALSGGHDVAPGEHPPIGQA